MRIAYEVRIPSASCPLSPLYSSTSPLKLHIVCPVQQLMLSDEAQFHCTSSELCFFLILWSLHPDQMH